MVIMAMDMGQRGSKVLLAFIATFVSSSVFAVESNVSLDVSIDETYTDNVTLSGFNEEDSFITTSKINLNSDIKSRTLDLSLTGGYSYLLYSHDSDRNKGYENLNFKSRFSPIDNLPVLIAEAKIGRAPRSITENFNADYISGDTVQHDSYALGLEHQMSNSDFILNMNARYSNDEYEDSVGESEGYQSQISIQNGVGANNIFWDIYGSYYDRENDGATARNYRVNARLGLITSYKINPFIKFSDEDNSGSIGSEKTRGSEAYGAGLRWLADKNLTVDLSYNFSEDTSITDDYVESSVTWTPTRRTSLFASYNQRFFGDSYRFNLQHANRRLTNTISYNETVQAFQRDTVETFVDGFLWCPASSQFDPNQCLSSLEGIQDPENYIQVPILGQRPVEDNNFSLIKELSWQSQLKLRRTSVDLSLSNRRTEDLDSGGVSKQFTGRFTVKRRLSAVSDFNTSWQYTRTNYDITQQFTPTRQVDYYRRYSVAYDRKLSQTFSSSLSLDYLDRSSNSLQRNYDETRISASIKKNF